MRIQKLLILCFNLSDLCTCPKNNEFISSLSAKSKKNEKKSIFRLFRSVICKGPPHDKDIMTMIRTFFISCYFFMKKKSEIVLVNRKRKKYFSKLYSSRFLNKIKKKEVLY